MWTLYNILHYSFGSIIWGCLIAIICMTLFVLLIKGWYKDATFSPISYIIGLVLFVLLSFQCILIVGSAKILESSDIYEQRMTIYINSNFDAKDIVSMESADVVIQDLMYRYPILQYYISGGDFSGWTAEELPHEIVKELCSFIHGYIFRRILWCLGFTILGAILVIKTMSHNYSRKSRYSRISTDRKHIRRTHK